MMKVGMIGLGIMGVPMARNIARAGNALHVWNRTPEKTQQLATEGAHPCASLEEMVQAVSHIHMMVYGPEALLELAGRLSEIGLQEKTVINSSTVSVDACLKASHLVEEAGGAFLDAPVSGSTGPAAAGELVFMVGGQAADLEGAMPLFKAMGRKIVHTGPVGSGTSMKLAIQILLGNVLGGLSEAMVFASSVGLDLQDFMDVANNGAMACPMVNAKGSMIAAGEFAAVSPMHQLGKDISLALQEADARGLSLPQSRDLKVLVQEAMEAGLRQEDVCAIFRQLQARQ